MTLRKFAALICLAAVNFGLAAPALALDTSRLPHPDMDGTRSTLQGFSAPGPLVVQGGGGLVPVPVFDATAYGLKGDGAPGDTSAMNLLMANLVMGGRGGEIRFPCGQFTMPGRLAARVPYGRHIRVNGAAPGCTKLLFPASDGLVLTFSDNSSSASITNIDFVTGNATGAYRAIILQADKVNVPQNAASSFVEHVSAYGSDGFGKTRYWGVGVHQKNVGFLNLTDYTYNGATTGGTAPLKGIGWLGEGDGVNVAVVANLGKSNFAYCAVAAQIGNFFQGFTFEHGNATGCDRGIYVPPGQTYNQQITVTGSQFNNGTSSVEFGSKVYDLHVTGNTFLLHGFGIKTAGVVGGAILGNSYSAADGATGQGSAIRIGTSGDTAEMITVSANSCLSIAGCITVEAGARGMATNNISWNVPSFYANASATFFQGGNVVNGAPLVSQAGPLGGVRFADIVAVNGTLGAQAAPTISSGFCTGASVAASNGTWSFRVLVGTGCATGTGVITMPTAAANGWSCSVTSGLNSGSSLPAMDLTASTATAVNIKNYARAGGATTAFQSGDALLVNCQGQ
ncbi:MAG: hypothetical protein EKK49_15305 [Rhodocyclaceae bacterium]|nr:MAG: hypothetical protein EKK49_15305 [Rhodocyclaceae bacterium]